MKRLLIILSVSALLGAGPGWAATCIFEWNPSTSSDVVAYRLYTAETAGGQVKNVNYVHIPVAVLPDKTRPRYSTACLPASWWVATALDTAGNESVWSNEIQLLPDTTAPEAVTQLCLCERPPLVVGALSITAVQASRTNSGTPQATVDGNPLTRWSAEGTPWIQYTLAAETRVQEVAIAWWMPTPRTYRFRLSVSMDGLSWQDVWTGQSTLSGPGLERYPFPPVTARYVRVTGLGNTANSWTHILESAVTGALPSAAGLDVAR